MSKYLLAALFLYLAFTTKGQQIDNWTVFFPKIQYADSLYKSGEYVLATKAYSEAFLLNNQHFSEGSRFDAARAWAKAGQSDSAIINLKQEVQAGFHNTKKLIEEPAFTSIRLHKEWKTILQKVIENEKADDKRLGRFKEVKQQLKVILVSDQFYRNQYDSVLTAYGTHSKQMAQLLSKMKDTDEKNVQYVSKLIDKEGWISNRIIGFEAGSALFLVIQHSDSATQEKYLPVMQQAVKDKKAFSADLALLEDRILLRRGQKQIYGSQVNCDSTGKNCWILPIEDEKNVDKRRSEVGLPPLAEYVKHWNIVYRKQE